MQSLLQYRRFGRHVRKQYERDLCKAKAIGKEKHDDGSGATSPDSSPGNAISEQIENDDDRDAEKGEQAEDTRGNHEDAPELPMESSMSHASQVATQGSMGTNLGVALTGINVRDRRTKDGSRDPSGHSNKVFVVGYEGERDSLNPHNWSYSTRIWATLNIASIGWMVGFASSVDSAALPQASAEFGVSEVVESLATGLFLVGFGTGIIVAAFPCHSGALFAGPVLETVGRNSVYIVTLSLYMIFIMASALAPNIGVQFVFRFIAGFFGPTPLTCAGGSTFGVHWKEFMLSLFSPMPPLWETFWFRLRVALYRPFILTFQEPVIMLLALYLTVIYVILFTFLNGYTFIFTETYGFSEGISGLSFIGIGVGLCLASLLVPFIYRFAKRDLAKVKAEGVTRLPPEFRLWFAMLGAPAIPISLFWMGWTARPSVSCWSPLLASVLFGYGILCVFISSYQYIIDSCETYSASALASVTLIRYVAAGGSIEYAIPFYTNVGVPWTMTILGAISALCVPLPYLFFVFGPRIRTRSKYAVV
ncbi:MAG: hypothetical protein Q9223_006314 [Gallowayella weberi]